MSKPNAAFDLSRAERQALFIANSLNVLFYAMPDDKAGSEISARFMVGSLSVMAEQLSVALMNGDSSHLMPCTMEEADHE